MCYKKISKKKKREYNNKTKKSMISPNRWTPLKKKKNQGKKKEKETGQREKKLPAGRLLAQCVLAVFKKSQVGTLTC